ncbi:DoxX family protein [Leptospira sp. GIMC2001]|uniref:DoxX family protein n=1 Tax=Leptospira sp. GIMC2001 TaxID=1513297 RepID=UPI00234B1C6E|nr:motility protein [Leptospira sp. GIMC2001]WCL50848.1 motility protein [Leptospira sp. GIMC2001]
MMKKFFTILMGIFYIVAGLNHFASPEFYLKMIPPYLPSPELLNYLSGVAEVALGIGVFIPKLRLWSCYGVIALLLAVFPANIYMLTEAMNATNPTVPVWGLVLRLPFQAVFIYWAWAVRK